MHSCETVFVYICRAGKYLRYATCCCDVLHLLCAMALPQEIRMRIVVMRYEQHRTAADIAEIVGCTERTVYNILRPYRDFSLWPSKQPISYCDKYIQTHVGGWKSLYKRLYPNEVLTVHGVPILGNVSDKPSCTLMLFLEWLNIMRIQWPRRHPTQKHVHGVVPGDFEKPRGPSNFHTVLMR